MPCAVGLVGLAVMGQNLALNIAENGFSTVVYNRTWETTETFLASAESQQFGLMGHRELKAFVAALERPRVIILMVKAGGAVDQTLSSLIPLLEPGDMVVDAGNSYYKDTERRERELAGYGLHFVGMGVSGGEEGARRGPSIMPGGPVAAWTRLEPILSRIAAVTDDGPCVTHIGPGGSGHFVKMVHNGIEYGDMQLIAEAYTLLRSVGGLELPAMAALFERWNAPDSELSSFLIEITAQILRTPDPLGEGYLLDKIQDAASMKGTGTWTVTEALELGAPVPTIAAAVDARTLSAAQAVRQEARRTLSQEPLTSALGGRLMDGDDFAGQVRDALFVAKVMSYAQGMALLTATSQKYRWGLKVDEISRIWKGGCIIRSYYLLERIKRAWQRQPDLTNLLLDPDISAELLPKVEALRKVVALAALSGLPCPAMSASLAWFDALRGERLPTHLIQAQRDFFGAHTFERVDRPGTFHARWS